MARYFGIDEANALLADVQPLLEQLKADRDEVARLQPEIERGQKSNGSAEHAEQLAELEREQRHAVRRMQDAVNQIDEWGVTLRDINTGLIDFPALASGRPIWLCWRLGEGGAITWWHEANKGFDSRQPLSELDFGGQAGRA
ncbi:MAG TPA: DUF2203 domain-containing protein [Candidatus Limnocylindria bacterium]|nr:DUF2203 domain-containing protein [Candidatus Limnocylindria bacterium]